MMRPVHKEYFTNMRFDIRWAAAGLALLATACGEKGDGTGNATASNTAGPVIAAPAGQDWTETAAATPEGGFRMGNPDAPVKLVEYASLTCPHCADFAINSGEKLKEAVKSGRVSWEFRNFILNPVDATSSLLARCQGAGPFFALVEQNFAEQKTWLPAAYDAVNAQQKRLAGVGEKQIFSEIAKLTRLDEFYAARGLPADKAAACLNDKAGVDALLKLREIGEKQDKVTGTPFFMINGKQVEGAFDWNTLEPAIRAAGG